MAKLSTLREWASNRHGAQRYGDEPYVTHLDEVAAVAKEFWPGDEVLQEGAYGHDLLEDTNTTAQDLRDAGWSEDAVGDIEAVTDVPAATRHERKVLTLPRIRQRGTRAVKLKLSDRIANARRAGKRNMYRAEQTLLEQELFDPSQTDLLPAWQHLRELLAA